MFISCYQYARHHIPKDRTVPKMPANKLQIIITTKLQAHNILELLAIILFTVVSSLGALPEHLRHAELKFMAINIIFNF